ncbi:MAG: SDR family oxidoreductase [Geminicoccaceae bacterium]|nr:SDR family oxidoreductase [Geminicoccaceae bacterium]
MGLVQYDLRGKRALVTGGASGIGLAAVTMLARAGAAVALNHLPGDPMADDALARLTAEGLDVRSAPGSVAEAEAVGSMVERAISDLGGLDYLVNNAGTPATRVPIPPGDLDAMTDGFWQQILDTNLLGPFRCTKAAVHALKEARGAIVSTASIAGINTQGSSVAYGASKAGVINLTRALARGLGPEIRVNAVAPGHVETPWTAAWPEERRLEVIGKAPMKRACQAEDIAEVMMFLLAGASMVTGQTIIVDGGLTLQ